MSNWNGLDFLIFLIFAVNTLLGMSRGATKEIISMMCINVALIIAIKFTIPLSNFLNSSPLTQTVLDSQIMQNFMSAIGAGSLTAGLLAGLTYSISMLICFVGAFSVCEATLAFSGAVEVFTFPYATWNRKVGGGMGFIRGYILTVVLVLLMQHVYTSDMTANSHFFNLFQGTAKTLDNLIGGQLVDQYKDIYKDKNLYNEQELYKVIAPEKTTQPNTSN